MFWQYILFNLLLGVVAPNNDYTIPKATVEAIYPKGLTVSVPDDGYTLFSFHGNLNTKLNGFEAGQWNKDYVKPKNGRWTFRDANVQIKLGDIISYWILVTKDNLDYKSERQDTITAYAQFLEPIPVASSAPKGFPCSISSTLISAPGFVCKGQLLFEDRFNGPVARRWKPENMFPGEPDRLFNIYSDEAISYLNGDLVISPIVNHPDLLVKEFSFAHRCTGKRDSEECNRRTNNGTLQHVITGKITSKEKFSFKFGRVEVRAKMPAGDWLIPEINLEPLEYAYGRNNSGLIKVAVVKGNLQFAKHLYGGTILSSDEPYRSKLMKEKIGFDNWSYDYHNYTVVWKPDSIDIFVDGEKYGHIPADWITQKNIVPVQRSWLEGSLTAPLDKLFYLSVGLQVGGVYDFEDSPTKPWKNSVKNPGADFWKAKDLWLPSWTSPELRIDYIRVYAF